MPILTFNFPKYGPRMKLFQVGLFKKGFQGQKTIQNVTCQED